MTDKSRIFAAIAPPVEPIAATWEVSTVELIRRVYDVPSVAVRALGQLDRFGAIRIAPEFVGFDKEDVPWGKISTVYTRRLGDVLTNSALEREVERLRKTLPPVPGRKWVLEKAASALGELCRTALDKSGSEALDRGVVSEIEYRGGLGRKKTLAGGLVVTAVLGLVPDANRILVSTASERGGAVVEQV